MTDSTSPRFVYQSSCEKMSDQALRRSKRVQGCSISDNELEKLLSTPHTPRKIYYCDICDYATPKRNMITEHVRYHSVPVLKCKVCDFETIFQYDLNFHEKGHFKFISYVCAKCKWTTDNSEWMFVHKKDCYFKCEDCDFQTPWNRCFVAHEKRHSSNRAAGAFKCSLCNYSVETIEDIQFHEKRHHTSSINENDAN